MFYHVAHIMRKQFETRVRLVIYMDARDLNRLTARAKREGRVLVAWAREVLLNEIDNALTIDNVARVLKKLPSSSRQSLHRQIVGANEPSFSISVGEEKYVHTATSNRLTCRCATCSEYRRVHDIPLGGTKRAKR